MDNEKLTQKTRKEWHLPLERKLRTVIRSFSLTEKTIFAIFSILLAVSAISLLFQVNKQFLVQIPDYGGTLNEGVIGTPRFINPLLATSDIDKDLTNLIYSGLLKIDSEGNLVPDLAESYEISEDSLTYTVVLKDDIYFHDNKSVTADDVIFTIEKTQDDALKSPRQANWSGVQVTKIDEKTIAFSLSQPYSPFIQNLTMGILPQHIWRDISAEEFPFSQFNTKPIGSGPYAIGSITYSGSGLPSEYHLKSFKKYSLGQPYITNIVLKSYQNERDAINAYKDGKIDSVHSVSPKELPSVKLEEDNVLFTPLPRIFGVFFNQNIAPVLVYKEVRLALEKATDKQAIIDSVLGGYGQIINSPVPMGTIDANSEVIDPLVRAEQAKEILTKAGWKLNSDGIFAKTDSSKKTVTLSFSISTGNAPELKDTAYLLQRQWQAIGALVEVKIFEIGDLNQNIIKPRKYDALLFGEIIGRDMDMYPFWHSSQRTTPGLNIALYTNLKADKLLDDIRKTTDFAEQAADLESFAAEIQNDIPAVFTYSPYFIYIVPKKVQNVKLEKLTEAKERWSGIHEWYIETDSVWQIFNNK